MKVHYLEIVSYNVNAVCKAYEIALSVSFSEPDKLLGCARTCSLPDKSIVGIKGPMRDTEKPVVRPYWLADDIEQAVANIEAAGAKITMPLIEIPGNGKFAIYILGANSHRLWQLGVCITKLHKYFHTNWLEPNVNLNHDRPKY